MKRSSFALPFAFARPLAFALSFAFARPFAFVLSLVLASGCAPTVGNEAAVVLGHAKMNGYHLLAGGNTTLPDGSLGFMITANGSGGYLLTFTDTAGSAAPFAGTLTTDVAFDASSTSKYSGNEDLSFTTIARIDFSGVPEATVEGVSFAAQTDPVYCDLTIGGNRQGFGIYFTGSSTGLVQESKYDPVAFASP